MSTNNVPGPLAAVICLRLENDLEMITRIEEDNALSAVAVLSLIRSFWIWMILKYFIIWNLSDWILITNMCLSNKVSVVLI